MSYNDHLSDDELLLKQFLFPTLPIAGSQRHNAMLRRAIVVYGYCYDEDRNPLWCWRAYVTARAVGDPIPDWVLTYLDRASAALWQRADAGWSTPKIGTAKEIAAMFEMAKGKGPGTLLANGADIRWIHDGNFVDKWIRIVEKEGIAIEEVAKRPGRSVSSTRRNWKRWKSTFISA